MSEKVLVLDNYDSFTYNLVHYIESIGPEVDVFRNDKITVEEAAKYKQIVLSPGPGVPKDAGIMPELIQKLAPTHKILGVCLGHQAIGEAFGGTISNLDKVYHGLATPCSVVIPDAIFNGLPQKLNVGRYHSWVVDQPLPKDLELTAIDMESNQIMAMRHVRYNVRGVQFHPESVLTEYGLKMVQNWLEEC